MQGAIAMTAPFRPIRKRRLSDEVTAQIRERIASGELKPGDKLPSEREMAESLQVSRGAVREAMRSLELRGLVDLQLGVKGGAFIGQGDPALLGDSFRDLYHLGGVSLNALTEARLWLESTVVRMACERANEDDLAALEANVDEAERLFKAGRYEDKIDVHIEFHNLLARATHNPVMAMLMGALMEVMRDFAHSVGGERTDETIRARRAFLAQMRDGDVGAAEATMAQHVRDLQQRYRKALAKDGRASSAPS